MIFWVSTLGKNSLMADRGDLVERVRRATAEPGTGFVVDGG